ncbi:hypothetical protein K501DRAFT_257023 [Backusella circina FSU 941]|nr:hypothetical protein K501DRAFT_257023 [Backusella circina FSU 941]
MKKSSPEKALKSIDKAVQLLDSKVGIDSQFPDLGFTFRGLTQNEYLMATEKAVQAFVIKNNTTMPQLALSQMCNLKPNSPTGIAPFMNSAYFATGNNIYFWNYKKRDDVVFHREDAEIVGVGFVTPQKDIFNDTIKKLMIIATTTSIKIIAISYNTDDQFTFIETGMMTSASGVSLTKIYGTAEGRVFMLAEDGTIWELSYQREEGWFTSKCYKRLLNPAGFSFLYRGSPETIVDLAFSHDGKIMYQLTQNSHIHVTSLVQESSGFNTVVKRTDIFNGARLLCPNSTLMDSQTFKITSLFPTTESERYQLVAITSTGCRLYFTHFKNGVQEFLPNDLELLHVRTPPPNEFQGGPIAPTSVYHHAVMLLVKEGEDNRLVVTNPDVGYLARTTNTSNEGLFEFSTTLQVTGKILSILELTTTPTINELAAPLTVGPRQYLVLTNNGLLTICKQRPIDMLQNLIADAQSDTRSRVQDFNSLFQHLGVFNGCALCFGLVTTASNQGESTAVTPAIIKGAEELIEQFGPLERLAEDGLNGLMLFIYRVIRPIWDKVLIKETVKDGVKTYTSAHPISQLRHTQMTLRKLNKFILKYVDTRVDNSLSNIYDFVHYLNQAIVFFLYIFESDSTAIIQPVALKTKTLPQKTLQQLLTTFEGRHLAGDIATSLIDFEFKKYQDAAYVIDVLEQHCGDFCGATDVILFKVARDIYNNNNTSPTLHEAFTTLKKLAPEIPSDKLAELATALAEKGAVVYAIQLALACATTRTDFEAQRPFYDVVFALLKTTITLQGDVARAMAAAFTGTDDRAYYEYIYVKFIRNDLGHALISMGSPSLYLETFLKQEPVTYERLNLLADYYRRNERYEDAAHTFIHLARIPANISIERRIELLTTAAVCAKSVTSPTKQYKMMELVDEIKRLQDQADEERRRQVSVHT